MLGRDWPQWRGGGGVVGRPCQGKGENLSEHRGDHPLQDSRDLPEPGPSSPVQGSRIMR